MTAFMTAPFPGRGLNFYAERPDPIGIVAPAPMQTPQENANYGR
jgi:hypothetical protein